MSATSAMRQFTIRLRMLGAIAMVLLLLGVLGGGGLWGMARIQGLSNDFVQGSFAKVQEVSALRFMVGQVRQSEKDMIIEYERTYEVEKSYKRWKEQLVQADQLAARFLVGQEDSDDAVVRELMTRLKVYEKAFEPIAKQLLQSGYESATTANRLAQVAVTEMKQVEGLLLKVELILQAQVDHSIAEQARVTHATRQLFILALALAIVTVVPLTLLNMRSICQPLERARLAARAIAGGDLSQRSEVEGKDEVADLQRALLEMQAGLGALVSKVRDASESVALASQEIASGNQDLSHRTEQTAASVQDTVGSLAELTGHVQ